MSNLEQKKNMLLKEVLKSYFTKKEITEFEKKFLSDDISKPALSKTNKSQVEINFTENSQLKLEIDLLITFAESKLTRNKFLELLLSLSQMAISSGAFPLAIDINEKIIKETSDGTDYIDLTANAFLFLGDLNSRQARWQLSFNNIKKARDLFDKQKDLYGKAKCENLLGTIYGEMGNLKKSKKFFENSLALVKNSKDSSLIAAIEINLGITNNIQGNYELALSYYQRALLNFQKVNNLKRIAEVKHNIGMTYLKLGKYDLALNNFDESISVALKAGSLTSLGITYVSKAHLYTLKKDFSLAEAFADKALDICYKTNDRLSIADIYKIKGIIQRNKLNYDTSANYLLTSLRINTELGNKLNSAETNYELGLLHKEIGNKQESKEFFNNAVKYFRSINSQPEIKMIEEAADSLN